MELIVLVVVAGVVVMLVAGLLLPRGDGHRVHRTRQYCAGNLKQIGLATLMYSGDNGGYFPNVAPNDGVSWRPVGELDYCTSLGKVWSCPALEVSRSYETFSAYRYIGSGLKDDWPAAAVTSLGYDSSANHPGNEWLNALFVDGHVEGARPGSKPYLTGND